MQFEYYVLNYDINKKKVEPFNIFNNCWVQEQTEKEIKKYIRNPKNYKYKSFWKDEKELYGFDALVKRIDGIIAGEEWGRCEYEMCVGEKFTPEVHDILKEIDKFNTLEELKEIPLKIGVAYGEHKVQSIKAGLRGHLIDVLITDRETAEKLI